MSSAVRPWKRCRSGQNRTAKKDKCRYVWKAHHGGECWVIELYSLMCYLYVKSPTSILCNCFLIIKLFNIIKAVWNWGKCMCLVWKDSNHIIREIIKKWMDPEYIHVFTLLFGSLFLCWNCELYPLLSRVRNLRINITEKTAWMEILSEIKLRCL